MKKIIALITAIATIFASCNGGGKTSVWKVTNGESVVYLGGSVHILRQQDFPLPSAFDKAFDKADVLVFEVDLNEMKGEEIQNKMSNQMLLPQGTTLEYTAKPKTYAVIKRLSEEFEVPMFMLDKIRPEYAVLMLVYKIYFDIGGMTEDGVDMYYFNKNKKAGKKIEWLETIDFQMNLLLNQMTFLSQYLDNEFDKYTIEEIQGKNNDDKFKKAEIIKEIKKENNKMLRQWRYGEEITDDDNKNSLFNIDTDMLNKKMLDERNKNWLPKIESYLNSGKTVFVVVGAGHMWGDNGLLNLLKQKGYKIEQM